MVGDRITPRRCSRWVALAMFAGVTLAACSSGGSGDSGGGSGSAAGLPGQVHIANIEDETGPASGPGLDTNKGTALATSQINAQHFLGKTRLSVQNLDSASTASTAASVLTTVVRNPSYSVALGPVLSSDALAMSPIAEKAKLPILYTEASDSGVVDGKYTWRASAAQTSFYYKSLEYLQKKGAKTLSVIYDSDVPTCSQIATQLIPSLAGKYGIKVISSTAIQTTTTAFNAPVTRALAGKPDAVATIPFITQVSGIAVALQQAGFKGPQIGYVGTGNGAMTAAGSAGKGMTYTTTFSPLEQAPSTEAFVKAYKAKYGSVPSAYAAEGYDRIWMVARALKAAKGASRQDVQAGIETVAKQGFMSAQGPATFKNNSMILPGVLVQWNGSAEVLASASS